MICRHASFAWLLQNALGVCFIAFLLQTVALPSGRVASVFLAALFCYDVFMVFITPLFMPRGESVMVRVATGGDTNEVCHIHSAHDCCDMLTSLDAWRIRPHCHQIVRQCMA